MNPQNPQASSKPLKPEPHPFLSEKSSKGPCTSMPLMIYILQYLKGPISYGNYLIFLIVGSAGFLSSTDPRLNIDGQDPKP